MTETAMLGLLAFMGLSTGAMLMLIIAIEMTFSAIDLIDQWRAK